jgi:hypothetical protein
MGGMGWLFPSLCMSKNSIKKLAAQVKFRHFLTVSCKTWVKISLWQQLCRLDLIVDFRFIAVSLLLRGTKLSQRELLLREWSVFPHDGHGLMSGLFARFWAASLCFCSFLAWALSFCFIRLCFALLNIFSNVAGSCGPVGGLVFCEMLIKVDGICLLRILTIQIQEFGRKHSASSIKINMRPRSLGLLQVYTECLKVVILSSFLSLHM